MPIRIAVQISGEFRTLYATWHKFQRNVLDISGNVEVDIFIHTWKRDEDGLGTFPFAERGDWHKTMYVSGHNQGIALYKPKAFEVENYDEKKDLHVLPRSMSMYYSIYRANEVRKDYETRMGVKYDIVMRYRTDMAIEENPFTTILPLSGQSIIVVPLSKQAKNIDGPVEQDSGVALCDWFALGTPDAMNIYCGTYLTWLQIGQFPMPESMLSLQLKLHGITKETILRRPVLDFYLVDSLGKMR